MTLKNSRFAYPLLLLFAIYAALFASQASARQQLEILDARYGTRHHSTDVAYILRGNIRHGSSISMRIDNDTMRGDPYPGRPKELFVRYLENGRERTTRVSENEWLNIGRSGGDHSNGGWPGSNWPDSDRGLEIVQADYGSGGRYSNVTSIVQRHVRGNSISLEVNNDTMGGDPRPHHPKELRVKYRSKNKIHQETIREVYWFTVGAGSGGSWQRPPARPPERPIYDDDLEIISARYGAHGRYWDVTDRVRRAARGGAVSLRVDNNTMGGDPAPHQVKELQVKYRSRGRKEQTQVPEGGWLSIN